MPNSDKDKYHRLRILMQTRIFINTIKEVEAKMKFVTLSKYYKAYFALDILYNLMYCVYPVYLFKFLINA